MYFFEKFNIPVVIWVFGISILGIITAVSESWTIGDFKKNLNWLPKPHTEQHQLDANVYIKRKNVRNGCIRYRTNPPGVPVSVLGFDWNAQKWDNYNRNCIHGHCPVLIRLAVKSAATLFVESYEGVGHEHCKAIESGQTGWKKNEIPTGRTDASLGGVTNRNLYTFPKPRIVNVPNEMGSKDVFVSRQEQLHIRLNPRRECLTWKMMLGNYRPPAFAYHPADSKVSVWKDSTQRWKYGGNGCTRQARLVVIGPLDGHGMVYRITRAPRDQCDCPRWKE